MATASVLGRMQRLVAPRMAAPSCRRYISHNRSLRVPRSSDSEAAVKELEQFSSGVRADLTDKSARKHPRDEAAQADTVSIDENGSRSTSSLDSVEEDSPTDLKLLQADTFWPFLEAAGDDLVVVDFYTDWCGPCKLIYPELVKLAAELKPHKVTIVKFNCNKANKDLGKELAIKVAPTFHLYRNKTKVAEMTGAKVDKLRTLINDQQVAIGKQAKLVSIEDDGDSSSSSSPPDEGDAADVADIMVLTQDNFWPFLEEAGNDLVVVDFYTDWCGPCKLIYPELVEMAKELKLEQVTIAKLNCNAKNKDLGKELAIRSAPTFHLYRNKTKVGELVGAEVDKLRQLISEQQAVVGKGAAQAPQPAAV